MAASLIRRIVTPSALAKLKPTQPLPKCFGFPTMRPLRTGAGKPMDATSNLHPRVASLSFAINCFGLMRAPDANSRRLRRDISSFTCVPPTSTTRTLFFISDRPKSFSGLMLTTASSQAFETLKDALRLRLCRRAGRPTFHDFKCEESEQHQLGRFQIEPQILCNLLDGPDAVELRCKLRLVRGQLQFLNTFKTVFRVGRNRCWIAVYVLTEILYETQGFQRPVVQGCLR